MTSTSDQAFSRSPGEDAIIEVRGLNVFFEMDQGRSRVINDVNVDIRRDEIFGIVGESGSGKSMFASSLLDAVVDPGITTGDVRYYPKNGDPVKILDLEDEELNNIRWDEISMVFQGAMNSFNPTMKIRGHFLETIRAHGEPIDERMDHARQLLKELYLEPNRVLDSYPHELSGGMKQRALIALSLVLEPEVLVMDEPTGALDLLMQRSIINLLANLQETYDLTIVFITHDLPLVAGLVDRLGVMYAFEFVEVGTKREILEDAAHPYTRALLASTPRVDAPVDEMRPIEGDSPDPVNVPSGCSYHPRCPLADEYCEHNEPERMDVEGDHEVACFYWEDARGAVPYTLGSGFSALQIQDIDTEDE